MTDKNALDIVRKNCFPRPLRTKEELDELFTETGDARDEQTDFRQNLLDFLEDGSSKTILVHGHRGCGKSTEINKLVATFDSRWLVVRVQSMELLPVAGNEAADVLLAASICLIKTAEEQGLALSDSYLEGVTRYFSETIRTKSTDKTATNKAGAGFDASGSLWGQLLGIKAELTSSLQFGSRTEESTIFRIHREKGSLARAFHALCLAVEEGWEKKNAGDEQARVILIIEELDKLGLTDAHQIFVLEPQLLGRIPIRAIFTIPVFTFNSPDARNIRSNFDHNLALPMIKTREQDGSSYELGKVIMRRLIRKRACAKVLPDEAMESLIERTGGVLRDVFQAIQTALTFKTVRETGVIGHSEINLALDRMVTEIGLQISYPIEEGLPSAPLREKLAQIAKKQDKGLAELAQPDRDLQILLMSGALIEHNGIGWLGVHPLARDYLKALGLL